MAKTFTWKERIETHVFNLFWNMEVHVRVYWGIINARGWETWKKALYIFFWDGKTLSALCNRNLNEYIKESLCIFVQCCMCLCTRQTEKECVTTWTVSHKKQTQNKKESTARIVFRCFRATNKTKNNKVYFVFFSVLNSDCVRQTQINFMEKHAFSFSQAPHRTHKHTK